MEKASARVALFNDTRSDNHFGCTLVIQQIISLLQARGVSVEWTWPVGKDWHSAIDWDAVERNINGIVVNGEGTIHRTAERERARWLTELAPFVASHTSLPIFLINATIHDIDGDCADNLCAYDGIFVRDSQSQHELSLYCIPSKVVPDISLSAHLAPYGERNGVCVTDSVLPNVTWELARLCSHHGWRWRPLRFAGKTGRPKLKRVIPDFPWWLANKREPESLAQRFASFVGQHELVVTGRYHMVTYCLLTETPFVALESNTPKIGALLKDVFGNTDRLISTAEVGSLDRSWYDYFTEHELAAIRAFMAEARYDTAAMIDEIRAITGSPLSLPPKELAM